MCFISFLPSLPYSFIQLLLFSTIAFYLSIFQQEFCALHFHRKQNIQQAPLSVLAFFTNTKKNSNTWNFCCGYETYTRCRAKSWHSSVISYFSCCKSTNCCIPCMSSDVFQAVIFWLLKLVSFLSHLSVLSLYTTPLLFIKRWHSHFPLYALALTHLFLISFSLTILFYCLQFRQFYKIYLVGGWDLTRKFAFSF